MPIAAVIRPNLYQDSVALMRVSQRVLAQAGVQRATLLMGTPANKAMLNDAGLWQRELDAARPNDVMIVVEADSSEAIEAAKAQVAEALSGEHAQGAARAGAAADDQPPPRAMRLARSAGASFALAQISVPGPYAAAEAMKALKLGLHVFLFSDNVPLEHERALKALASRKGLLVMGPDCGTAIVRGVPLGFANVVRDGGIGLVGASGTGLQEVSCQIHARGEGVSHVIGTGGRDMYDAIGGTTMCQALDLLAADAGTRVIGIVAKSPTAAVGDKVIAHAHRTGKPCVVLFLGAKAPAGPLPPQVTVVATLEEAAQAAVCLLAIDRLEPDAPVSDLPATAAMEARRYAATQRYVRGLYSGGTFCAEAQLLWRETRRHRGLERPYRSRATWPSRVDDCDAHAAIDFGADEYTVGRPHPMIDMGSRIARLAQEARDPSVAVVTLDVVLGYGSHDDPASALAPAIEAAIATAAKEHRHLSVVCFVCGTEDDPQKLSVQQAKLRAAGALVMSSSTAAARLAGAFAAAAAIAAGQRATAVGQQ